MLRCIDYCYPSIQALWQNGLGSRVSEIGFFFEGYHPFNIIVCSYKFLPYYIA
jgi:hypothetical protein